MFIKSVGEGSVQKKRFLSNAVIDASLRPACFW